MFVFAHLFGSYTCVKKAHVWLAGGEVLSACTCHLGAHTLKPALDGVLIVHVLPDCFLLRLLGLRETNASYRVRGFVDFTNYVSFCCLYFEAARLHGAIA